MDTAASEVGLPQQIAPRLAYVIAASAAAVWGFLHLVVFSDVVLPLTYVVPLLICIWTRSRRTVWAMAAVFGVFAAVKLLWDASGDTAYDYLAFASRLVNILVAAGVVHAIISLRQELEQRNFALTHANQQLQEAADRIEAQNEQLQAANQELSAVNEELLLREEEIRTQNDELRVQSEELAEQNEELQTQSEELEQQAEELSSQAEELTVLNEELSRRERMLEALLAAARSGQSEGSLLDSVCRHGVELLGEDTTAASVVQATGEGLRLAAHVAAAGCEPVKSGWPLENSLAQIVMAERRTACLEDTRIRPDLKFPDPGSGEVVRSVLAAPLVVDGQVIGAIEFYCTRVRPWTQDQFRLAEWVAAHASLILDSVRLRADLQESEQRFRAIFERAAVGIAQVSVDGRFLRPNPGFCAITGYSAEELTGRTFQDITHPDDVPTDLERLARLIAGDIESYVLEKRYIRKDGSEVWVNLTVSAVRDEQRRPRYFIAVVEDISARRTAEERLAESRRHLRLILDTAPVSINYVDAEQRFQFANRAYAARLGYTPDEVVGRSVSEICGEQAYAWIGPRLQEALAGKSMRFEMHSFYAGHVRDLALAYEPDFSEDGRVRGVVVVLEDISDRRAAEIALSRSEQHLRLALESGGMGTWEWTPGQERVEWSEGHYRLLGFEPGRVESSLTTWSRCVHPDDRDRQARDLQQSMDERRDYASEFRVVWPDGSVHWLEARGRYVFNEDGRPVRMYGVLIPISLRKQIEQERLALLDAERAARTEAERVNRLKDEFLATVSHELRSPLNAIVGWTRLLARGKAETVRAVEIIERSASALTQLVEDLLDMSRIISGKIRLKRERVDVRHVVTDVMEGVLPAAEAKGIHIDLSFDPALETLECDPNRIQQIIWNLLSNAIKFTPSGGHVLIAVARSDDHVEFVVRDTGQGISTEFLPHLFGRFRQADGSIARKHGGLGLGLSIVKHLVELHGGTIRAESEGENKGSTFTVSIPCDGPLQHGGLSTRSRGLGRSQAAGSAPADPESLHGLSVVVIDDDVESCELLARVLGEAGADVRLAHSAADGLQLLEERKPELLISDIGMPGQDGYSFMRQIRSPESPWADLTCMAVTALARVEDRKRAADAGFDEHLSKPYDSSTLLSVVARLADRRGLAQSRPVSDVLPVRHPKPDEDPKPSPD